MSISILPPTTSESIHRTFKYEVLPENSDLDKNLLEKIEQAVEKLYRTDCTGTFVALVTKNGIILEGEICSDRGNEIESIIDSLCKAIRDITDVLGGSTISMFCDLVPVRTEAKELKKQIASFLRHSKN